jgi:sugar lactone lactonase YvrE
MTSTEKDIFPEGLAYDPNDDSFYLGSVYHRKIIKLSREGKTVDLVPTDRYNLLPILGIRLDPSDGSIWSNSANDVAGTSELLHFDRSGTLLARYSPSEKGKHDFNDLVVLRSGAVYLTDTLADKVYRFDSKSRAFTPVQLARQQLAPNGIALTDDEQTLYVADQLGVLRLDLKSGTSAEVDPTPHNTLAGIDGLYWHKDSLVAVQNGIGTPRVAVFRLSPDGLRVTKITVLQNFLKTPTTGAIRGDDFYFILNTQIDNLNGEHILDVTKLQPVRIAIAHLP